MEIIVSIVGLILLSILGACFVVILHIYFPVWQRDIKRENRECYAKCVRSGLDPAKGEYRRHELIDYLKFVHLTGTLDFLSSDELEEFEERREQRRKDEERDKQIRRFIDNAK